MAADAVLVVQLSSQCCLVTQRDLPQVDAGTAGVLLWGFGHELIITSSESHLRQRCPMAAGIGQCLPRIQLHSFSCERHEGAAHALSAVSIDLHNTRLLPL